jgi:hypothetical protein
MVIYSEIYADYIIILDAWIPDNQAFTVNNFFTLSGPEAKNLTVCSFIYYINLWCRDLFVPVFEF